MKTKILTLSTIVLLLLSIGTKVNATKHIIMSTANFTFDPNFIGTVMVGDTVRWNWTSGFHTTTSAIIPPGAVAWNAVLSSTSPYFEYPVVRAGTYNYICVYHEAFGMVGSFVVSNPPPPTSTITGVLSYNNSGSQGMGNSTIQLFDINGILQGTTSTGANGSFTFSNLSNGTYTLHASTLATWGGVNSLDALTTLEHFVNLVQLTGLKLHAADVDNNNFINSLDALYTAKRFVGIINSFPAGDWYFESPSVIITSSGTYTQNLQGICYGDCNGSYVFAAKSPASITQITGGTTNVREGASMMVPVKVNKNISLGAISLIIDYPENELSIEDVITTTGKGNLVYKAEAGELKIAWFSLDAMNLNPGDIMLWVKVKPNKGLAIGKEMRLNINGRSVLGDIEAKTIKDVTLSVPILKNTNSIITHIITQQSFTFSPSSLTGVLTGDTIKWVWTSGTHTTTSGTIPTGASSWDAPLTSGNTSFKYKALVTGTYNYVCTYHATMGMVGSFMVGQAAGIDNISNNELSSLTITPNPLQQQTQLTFTSSGDRQGNIRIYNVLGGLLYNENLSLTAGINTKELDLSNLARGIYILQLSTGGTVKESRKIIKE